MQQHNISLLSRFHRDQPPPRRLFSFIFSVPLISSVSLISLSHSQSIAASLSGQVACRYQFPGLVLSGCVPPAAAVVFLFQPSTILTAVQLYGTYNDLITVKLYGIYNCTRVKATVKDTSGPVGSFSNIHIGKQTLKQKHFYKKLKNLKYIIVEVLCSEPVIICT